MRRNHELKHQHPADARFASVNEAFIAALKPMVRLWIRDEQSREVLRLDEEPVRKDKVA